MNRLYVSDLDGTLLQDDATLSSRSRQILIDLLSDGLPFTVATARSYASFRVLLAGLPLSLPVIELNGAYLSDFATGEHLFVRDLPADISSQLLDAILSRGLTPYLSTFDGEADRLYCPPAVNDGMEWYIADRRSHNDPRLLFVEDVTVGLRDQIVCVTVIGDEETTSTLHDELKERWGRHLQMYHWRNDYSPGWHWLTIQDIRVSKAQALDELISRLADRPDQIFAFGDQSNDMQMLRRADRGIAVANATDELKKVASETIGSNMQDSVADYLQAHWKGNCRSDR